MSPELHARAGRLWAARARFEREAERRFAALARDLAAVGAPAELVQLAERSSADEARHAVLAAELARSFGAAPAPAAVGPLPPLGPRSLTSPERVLYASVALCAVMESLSAVLLRAMRAEATGPVREVLHAILVDEITHSRIGWGHLAFEARRGDVGWLAPLVPAMFAATVQEELYDAPEGDHGAALEPYGGLRRERRRALVEEALAGLVLPGLAELGVDPGPGTAWLQERAARPLAAS